MRLGRVEVSAGCLLLLAWLHYWDTQGVVALGLLACLLHELAHYGALRLAGAGVRRVRLPCSYIIYIHLHLLHYT